MHDNKRAYGWIEQLRTFSMLLVVVSHMADYYIRFRAGNSHPLWYGILSCVITVAVPTFFLLSGYLVALKKVSPKKQLCRLVTPLVIWSCIYAGIGAVYLGLDLQSMAAFFNLFTGYRHLYFLVALIQLHCLYFLISPYLDKNRIYGLLIIYGGVTLMIYGLADITAWTSTGTMDLATMAYEGILIKFGLSWGLFYFLGIFFALRPQALKHLHKSTWKFLFLSSLTGVIYFWDYQSLFVMHGGDYRKYLLIGGLFYQLFGALFLLAFSQKMIGTQFSEGIVARWLEREGRYTFGIYLIHPAIIIILFQAWDRSTLLQFVPDGVIFVCMLPVTWLLSRSVTKFSKSFVTGKFFCQKVISGQPVKP